MGRTENLTIMFTDVVDYTRRTSGQSRTEISALLKHCNRLLLPIIHRFGGWQVKNLGDALLVAFHSPTDALRCGMAQQDAVADSNRYLPAEQHLHIRVAVTVGEVLLQDNDVFGEAVNLAARLEQVTPPDAIYFTEAVYLAMNRAEVTSQFVGTEQFKGIPEPVRIYQVPPSHISRLVSTDEPLSRMPDELPFGGMHLAQAEVSLGQRLRNQMQETLGQVAQGWKTLALRRVQRPAAKSPGAGKKAAVAAGLLLLAGLLLWWVLPRPEPTLMLGPKETAPAKVAIVPQHLLLERAQPLLAAGRYDDVRALYQAELSAHPDQPEALLLQGHDQFQRAARTAGLESYQKALAGDATLRKDLLLAHNLVLGLGYAAATSSALIEKYATPAMFTALAERTGQPGGRGRQRAAELLKRLDQSTLVDRFGMASQDLREADSCEQRLAALRKLRALRDPRALPKLEALLGGGIAGWWNNRCLRDEAEAAIAEIKRR